MPHFELPFFTNLLILLVGAKILGEMFERIGQPSMIGEIIAGIILGPSILNLIHRTEDIKVISELGVFLLVIMAGLEIRIEDILKSLKGRNIIISILAFFVPLGTGLAVGFTFNQPLMTSVFIALCIAITALPVSIRILMDLGQINSEVGQRIISVAIFDDILALTILGVLITIKDTDLTFIPIIKAASWSLIKLIIFLILLSFAYYGIQRITKKGDLFERGLNKLLLVLKGKEPLFALFFAFILTFSMITESLGLHFIVGAFFASMLITEAFIGKDNLRTVEKTTTNMAMGFLAPIFFAGIGLEFSVTSISNFGLLFAILIVSYSTKIIAGFIGGKIARLSNWSSITLGIGLNARGIMELVIANIAYKAKIINVEIFSMLVIMGVLTTLTTPIALKYTFKRIKSPS